MRVDKPWGYEIIWAKTDRYVGKLLHINAGQKLSLQYHNLKDETIYVQSGHLVLQIGEALIQLQPGESYHIPVGTIHRFMAGVEPVELMEVSTPELDDVVRLQDDYGRSS